MTLTSVTTAGAGTVAINEDGVSVYYTPALDFNGIEVITYTITDGNGGTSTATVIMCVAD